MARPAGSDPASVHSLTSSPSAPRICAICPADPVTPARIQAGGPADAVSSGNSSTPTDMYRLVTPATTILLATSVTPVGGLEENGNSGRDGSGNRGRLSEPEQPVHQPPHIAV